MNTAKILIVDDEIEFATALAERLQLRDYDAHALHCAEDALAAARSGAPDIIIVDLKMPGMGGLDMMKALRQFNQNIQVIIMSGQEGNLDIDEELQPNFIGFVMKPVIIDELTELIDAAIARKSSASPQGEPHDV